MSKGKFKVRFLASTILGGVLFLLPLTILIVVLVKAAQVMMIVAEPMAALFPIDSVGGVALANLIALLVVILLCFISGLIARHAMASKVVKGLESKVLVNVPGYMMIKNLITGFVPEEMGGLKPVLLTLGSAERLGFEIQKLEDGRSMVFMPSVPSPFSGITQVLPPEQITYLDIPVSKIIEVTENFGYGADQLIKGKGD